MKFQIRKAYEETPIWKKFGLYQFQIRNAFLSKLWLHFFQIRNFDSKNWNFKSEILIPIQKTNKWSPIRNYDSKPRILMPNEKKCSENFTWESETQMPTCHFHTIYVPTFKGGLKTATFKLLSIHFVKLHLGIRISDFLQKEFLIPSVVIFWLHHSEPGQMQIL